MHSLSHTLEEVPGPHSRRKKVIPLSPAPSSPPVLPKGVRTATMVNREQNFKETDWDIANKEQSRRQGRNPSDSLV
jgi:hypothetical protein